MMPKNCSSINYDFLDSKFAAKLIIAGAFVTALHTNNGSEESGSRICIIGNQANSLLNFRSLLIEDLIARKHKVLALAPDFDEVTLAALRALGAEPISYSLSRTSLNPFRDARNMFNLAALFHKLKPDIILGYSIKPAIYGIIAAWLARIPKRFAMIEGLGYIFTSSEGTEKVKRRGLEIIVCMLYAIALRCANLTFFLNKDDLDEFSKKRLVPAKKAFLLGAIGIDLNQWQPLPLPTDAISFIMISRLLKEKGILEYAQASRIVKLKHPGTKFVLLGNLDTNPSSLTKAEIMPWVEEGILEWPGYVPDVRPWLAQASVFVMPSSYREGVPRSTQEAMAMARPIITTDAPGCRETVIDGENGFLVPIRNAEVLADTMERFIQHPDLIARMGQASRRIAEERFDAKKANKILMEEMGIC
jgi:glycosyltransferase involved in cell wall biosynthesis